MSKKSSFTLNTKIFEASLLKWANEIKDEAKEGAFEAFAMLLDDAKWKPPQAPFKTGDLHGSAEVDEIKITSKAIEISGGFNIEYATKQHEQETKYAKPTTTVVKSPGPKFLETKMVQYSKDYGKVIIDRMKRSCG